MKAVDRPKPSSKPSPNRPSPQSFPPKKKKPVDAAPTGFSQDCNEPYFWLA